MAHPRDQSLMTIILAAGKGTRMKSDLPKVLHPLGGKPLIAYMLNLARSVDSGRILIVVGYQSDRVIAVAGAIDSRAEPVLQEPQMGTGHALLRCLKHLEDHRGPVLVLSGDVPGLTWETVRILVDTHAENSAAVTVLTSVLEDPVGYGRIVRDRSGRPLSIVEQGDLLPQQESIKEINTGVYVFDGAFLVKELPRLSDDNAQGEFYLPDLVKSAVKGSMTVATVTLENPEEAMGVNTLRELADMENNMREKTIRKLMEGGVRIIDPRSTYIDESAVIEPEAVIHPMTFIYGKTRIGAGTVIQPGAVITDSNIGRDVEIRPYSVINQADIDDGVSVGPFAHLRPGSVIGREARVGNFVEIKKATLGEGSKVSHLTYIGDASLGREVNIGAGCVTCNYDGFSKHRTIIEDGVFVGSGTMMVAPVTLGPNSMVAAGSTITRDVPGDALAIARSKQGIKEGWTRKWREETAGRKSGDEEGS